MLEELLPPALGTICVSLLAVATALPFSVITGIFISEYLSGRIQNILILFFKILSAVPSVIVGLCGFILILSLNTIFGTHFRTSLFLSALSLAILITPYIVIAVILGFREIPKERRLCAVSLGAEKYQNIFYVLLPESLPFIFSGIILAVARAVEDTAVIMLTGAAAFSGFPTALDSSFEALPFFIYYHSAEYSTKDELIQIGTAAVILIIISVGLVYLSDSVKNKIGTEKR